MSQTMQNGCMMLVSLCLSACLQEFLPESIQDSDPAPTPAKQEQAKETISRKKIDRDHLRSRT